MKYLGSKKSVRRRQTHGTPGGGRGNIGSPEKRGCSKMARRSTGGKTGLEKNGVWHPPWSRQGLCQTPSVCQRLQLAARTRDPQ